MLGYVEDVREPLARYAVFVCPILSGSGVRVKLLEAFAAGIPVVSTWVGAEGLAVKDGEFCALADDPGGIRRAGGRPVARPRACRRDGGAGASRSGRPMGHGCDHATPGGGLRRHGEGEASVTQRSALLSFQIVLDTAYNVVGRAFQISRRPHSLAARTSTRSRAATSRPPETPCPWRARTTNSCAGFESLFTVSPSIGLQPGPPVCVRLSARPAAWRSAAEETVRRASLEALADLVGEHGVGELAGRSRPGTHGPTVSRFARYWSSPLDILSRYTVCTVARSAAHSIAAEQDTRSASRFILPMISRRAALEKRRTHV